MYGVSCHAMEPNNGINAGILLCEFLRQAELDDAGQRFVQVVTDKFSNDTRGKKLNIDCEDEISGELTLNVGTLRYTDGQGGELGINIRYPVTAESNVIRDAFESASEFELGEFKDSKPHHVSADHPLVKTLQRSMKASWAKS